MRGAGRWIAVVVVVGSLSTGIAIAGGGRTKTKPVTATFQADRVKNKQRPCDSKHVRVEQRYVGFQKSDYWQLTGDIEIRATSVVSLKNRWGRTEGEVVIRKPYSPKHSFEGEFVGVVEPDGGVEGFVVGETKGHHDRVHLFANFNVNENPDHTIDGELGQDTQMDKPYAPHEHQDPAIVTDACFKKHGHGGGHHHR